MKAAFVHQCKHCLTVYDETVGEPLLGIERNMAFENLPIHFTCPLCEAAKTDFVKMEKTSPGLQPF